MSMDAARRLGTLLRALATAGFLVTLLFTLAAFAGALTTTLPIAITAAKVTLALFVLSLGLSRVGR